MVVFTTQDLLSSTREKMEEQTEAKGREAVDGLESTMRKQLKTLVNIKTSAAVNKGQRQETDKARYPVPQRPQIQQVGTVQWDISTQQQRTRDNRGRTGGPYICGQEGHWCRESPRRHATKRSSTAGGSTHLHLTSPPPHLTSTASNSRPSTSPPSTSTPLTQPPQQTRPKQQLVPRGPPLAPSSSDKQPQSPQFTTHVAEEEQRIKIINR